MQRVPREQVSRNANSNQVAQSQFSQASAQSDFASRFDNSPRMIAQRKLLQSLFGDAIQRVEEEEPLQGKFVAQPQAEEKASVESPHARGCSCPNCSGLVVQKMSTPIQRTDDMKCDASIMVGDDIFNGQATNNRWKGDARKVTIQECPIIYTAINKVANKSLDPNMHPYGWAEPGAIANAVLKMPSWNKQEWSAKRMKVLVDDTKMLKDFPKQNLHIGDIKPRCVNCSQWIPGNELTLEDI
jgi:hypothetical protein